MSNKFYCLTVSSLNTNITIEEMEADSLDNANEILNEDFGTSPDLTIALDDERIFNLKKALREM